MSGRVLHGDCLGVMATFDAATFDAIITDPPYGLAFMGKTWDHGVPGVPFWAEALRVAKPGAHLVAFGGSRTYHRLTCAIEDAGWGIRDCLSYLYGSGFPKSHDVSKAIDKAAGAERAITSTLPEWRNRAEWIAMEGRDDVLTPVRRDEPVTDIAREWQGWGTALKPAWEPIILARKPLSGAVAANVQAHGTGALNIDGCRIGIDVLPATRRGVSRVGTFEGADGNVTPERVGRWPANVCLDQVAATLLDEQSGDRPGMRRAVLNRGATTGKGLGFGSTSPQSAGIVGYDDAGGASRFFYTAKASRSEREAGLDHVALRQRDVTRDPDAPGGNNPRNRGAKAVANHHPTVKPVDLMRWLCRLVTPPHGLILDPFTGSGTTGVAATLEDCRFIGIEREAEYVEIARARLRKAQEQPSLFAPTEAA